MSQTTNLNMIPQRNVRNLYFSQNDVGRVATVNLVDGGTPYSIPIGATVKIQATKPSGLGFSETCTFSGSTVTVTSTATMTDEAGIFPCEIQVTNSGVVLGSANFNFFVERNPHPNGTTDGTAESILNDITVAYNHAMDQIENAGGLTVAIKNALLNCFQKVAWIDEHGQDYYDALADELFAVTGITLNSSTLLFSSLGSTQQLTASLIPSTSTATVSWASSDTSVATVSSSGLVTSVANGSATITASVGSVSATCSVSVSVATVTSISAVLNASGHTFYVGDPVDDIKPYLTVTATYSDSSTQTVPSGSYTLSGTLSQVGANTITVSYESVTTTVSVTCAAAELSYISAVYTQSGTVYDTDTLDSLKSDLVVTAHYSDSTTSTVASADYTLSGTLAEGTSAITVTYQGMTTTFNVTVSVAVPLYPFASGSHTFSDGSVLTISNGNHVKFECNTSVSAVGPYNPFFNLSNIEQIATTDLNNPDSVNNKAKTFSLATGDVVKFSVDNVVTDDSNYQIQLNMRTANSTTSIGSNYQLNVVSSSGNSVTVTSSAVDVSCAYAYFAICNAGKTYEFDMHLTVNDVVYY